MKIFLATDGSPGARAAADVLARLPLPEGSEVMVLAVVESQAIGEPDEAEDADERRALETARSELEEAARETAAAEGSRLLEAGLSVKGVRSAVREGHAAEQIVAAAGELSPDLLVIGALKTEEGRRSRLGDVSRSVTRHAPCSVLVARPAAARAGAEAGLQVLLAYDGSETARAAAQALAALPLGEDTTVTVLGVLTASTAFFARDVFERTSPAWQRRKKRLQDGIESIAGRLRPTAARVDARLVDGGTGAADEILEAAALLDADLVVAGSSGVGAIRAFLIGSVADQLVEYAPCSVWLVKPGRS